MGKDIYKFTEKLKNGKYRIREGFNAWGEDAVNYSKKLPLQESNRIIENNGLKLDVLLAVEVPVWKLDKENLNGRVYPYAIGQKVVDDNLTTVNLKDHPEDEGSVDNIIAISNNPHIRDGILYVDSYYVDEEFAKKMSNILKLKGQLGVSSSVFADMDDDGYIKIDGFELERYWDQVLNPSYQVYVSNESIISNNNEDKFTESKDDKKIESKPKRGRKVMKEDKVDLYNDLVQKNFEKEFNKALKSDKITEKISSLEYLLEGCQEDDFLSKNVNMIQEELDKLYEDFQELADKGMKTDILEETLNISESEKIQTMVKYETLKTKYNKSCQLLDESKSFANNLRKVLKEMEFKLNETIENSVEKSKYRKLSKAYRELKENYDGIYEECEEMDKVIEKLELSNKTLTKKYEKTLSDFNSLKEGYTKIKKEHKSLVEDYNFLIDENEKLERKYESTVDSFEKKETLRKKRESEIERKKRLEAERLEAEREYELDKRIREKRIKESKVNWYEETQEQVKDYYYDLVRTRPSVVKIKEEILSCKNLEEAQNLYFKLDRELEKDENKISDMKYRRMESRDSDYEDGDDLVINHNYKDMNTRIKENKLYERDITGRETEDLDFNFTGEGFKLYEKENIQIPEHLSKIDESELEDLKF